MRRFFVMAILAMTLGITTARSQNKAATLPANQQDLCALAKLICPECKEFADNTEKTKHRTHHRWFTKKKRHKKSSFKKIVTSSGVTIEGEDGDDSSSTPNVTTDYFVVKNPNGSSSTIGVTKTDDSISLVITTGGHTSTHTVRQTDTDDSTTSDTDETDTTEDHVGTPTPNPVMKPYVETSSVAKTTKIVTTTPCDETVTRLQWQPIKQKQAFLRGSYPTEPDHASPMVQMVCALFKNNPDLTSLIFHTDGTIEAHGCITGSLSEQILTWCRIISTRG
jgi:hypothetical protein